MSQIDDKAQTGIGGLEDVKNGGFSSGHVFLLEGEPLEAFQSVLRDALTYEGTREPLLEGRRP
jgi:KaiC/GvpD/RAD55 family RecA-like ATPase